MLRFTTEAIVPVQMRTCPGSNIPERVVNHSQILSELDAYLTGSGSRSTTSHIRRQDLRRGRAAGGLWGTNSDERGPGLFSSQRGNWGTSR